MWYVMEERKKQNASTSSSKVSCMSIVRSLEVALAKCRPVIQPACKPLCIKNTYCSRLDTKMPHFIQPLLLAKP